MLPPSIRSMSSDKALPSLPTNEFRLDLSGLPSIAGESGLGSGLDFHPKSSKPFPAQFIPVRSSPLSTRHPPISTPSILSLSPSNSTSSYPFPYVNHNYSTSTVTNQSTSTLIPSSPSISISTASPNLTTTPKKQVKFGKSSMSADSIKSDATSSNFPAEGLLGRKRSSGQLLSGLGKGLNRVGSVMRRNTEGSIPTLSPRKANGGTWRKGRRRKTDEWLGQDESWEKVDRQNVDNGDEGIGRPFNVEHDLHVSPDLSDLPESWLSSLKAQGLTESDLLLISASRRKQHHTQRVPLSSPLRTTSHTILTPLSTPSTSIFDISSVPTLSRTRGSPGLLKKFSFEITSSSSKKGLNTSTQHQPTRLLHTTSHLMEDQSRRTVDSFPISTISAIDPSDTGHQDNRHQEGQERNAESLGSSQLSPRREDCAPTRRSKRFSYQIREFRESTFGIGEEDEGEWCKGIFESTLINNVYSSPLKDRIPVPEETLLTLPYRTKSPSQVDINDKLPQSPPPPARPKQGQRTSSLTSLTFQAETERDEQRTPVVEPIPRESSESFGVHYTSLSKSSIGSDLITPSTSMKHDMDLKEKGGEYDFDDDDKQSGFLDGRVSKDGQAGKAVDNHINSLRSQGNFTLRKHHSNPHISLPASASPSRSSTPEHQCQHTTTKSDSNYPNQYHSSPKRGDKRIREQLSYSTFDTSPYRHTSEDELLDGLDKANPEERASIALSILSNRTSTSIHSLHELSQATVTTAYKLPRRHLDFHSSIPSMNRDNIVENTVKEEPRKGGAGEMLGLVEETSECSSFTLSTCGSEDNDGEAKDAMEALGEAARRLRGL
ncbi:uncharacterized protein IL334_002105 [Kwoniella shivajii]|uniref:CRIB domain-containing protein n=1 Tax=Kwoniella shivajii TaxID=564305 RepID=A0ABZ1CUX9_9TREE|nr:hypothetical protein IL334_002105 [Kwoniella shivajii]